MNSISTPVQSNSVINNNSNYQIPMQAVAQVKAVKKVKKVQKAKIPAHTVIDQLRRNEDLVGNVIAFKFADGTTKNQVIRKEFVYSDKGRMRSTQDILEDINAIAWDFNAESFEIE